MHFSVIYAVIFFVARALIRKTGKHFLLETKTPDHLGSLKDEKEENLEIDYVDLFKELIGVDNKTKENPMRDYSFDSANLKGTSCVQNFDCLTSKDGRTYVGNKNRTARGQNCLSWRSVGADGNRLHENYCRNPDGDSTIWCYTKEDGLWEYCSVKTCKDCKKESPKTEELGDECGEMIWSIKLLDACTKYVLRYFWMQRKTVKRKTMIEAANAVWKVEIELKNDTCQTIKEIEGQELTTTLKDSKLCSKSFTILLPNKELAGSKLMVDCITNKNKKIKNVNRCKRPKSKSPFRVTNKKKPSWSTDDQMDEKLDEESNSDEEYDDDDSDFQDDYDDD